jgi:trimeric autotransporter adhesin
VTGSNVNDFLVKQPTRWENTTPANVKTILAINNVDNTSDANKPISTATQTALDGKVDKVAGKGLSTEDYTTAEKNKLAGIEAGAQVNTVTSVAGKTGAVSLVKADVGLSNVDNTSDLNKPISTATQTALNAKQDSLGFIPENVANKENTTIDTSATKYPTVNLLKTGLDTKEPAITAGTTGQYYRGDKTFQTLDKTAVGLGNVDNTSDANKPISTATQTALDAKQDTLVSGTNIKTINGQSVVGSGNLTVTATAAETFETVSKNLKAYPAAFNYTTGTLTSIVYTLPVGTITKTLNYTSGTLTSIVLSGDTPAGIDLTKTLGYTGDTLTSITYT